LDQHAWEPPVPSFLHEVSSQLAKTHAKLVVEDLNVAGLVRNSRLARAVGDAAWTDFGRQLSYKAAWLDGELMLCDRWSPLRGPVGGVGRSSDRCGWRSAPFVATAAV
jgi:putative transposase